MAPRLSAGWAVAIVAVSAVRWFGSRRFACATAAVMQSLAGGWAVFSVLGALATGVLWGVGTTVLFPAVQWYQVFLSLVVGGMCAGAITVNAAHVPTAVAFILPAALPLAASFLAQGPGWRVSALMVVIFAAALCAIGLATHRAFGFSNPVAARARPGTPQAQRGECAAAGRGGTAPIHRGDLAPGPEDGGDRAPDRRNRA